MIKALAAILISTLLLSSCNKVEGCGTVKGFRNYGESYQVYVEFVDGSKWVTVDSLMWIKLDEGETICF